MTIEELALEAYPIRLGSIGDEPEWDMNEQYRGCWIEGYNKALSLCGSVEQSFRKKLTYEERVQWFVDNFYETGMEYKIMLDNMKNDNLDNFKWYDDFIKIPKYKDEL